MILWDALAAWTLAAGITLLARALWRLLLILRGRRSAAPPGKISDAE